MNLNTLLKNVTAYKVAEPLTLEAAQEALESKPFHELAFGQTITAGIVVHPFTGELVTPLLDRGSFAFCVRIDEKNLPPRVLKAEVQKAVDAIEEAEVRKVYKKEREDLADAIRPKLIERAFVDRAFIHCLYDARNQYLLLSGASKWQATVVMSTLIEAFGTLRTSTIHVDDVSNGITTRLKAWLNNDDQAFERFNVGGKCRLVRKDTDEKVTFAIEGLRHDVISVIEALENGFGCDLIELQTKQGNLSFTLTNALKIKSVEHEPLEHEDNDDLPYQWRAEASARAVTVTAILKELCAMFGYQDEAAPDAAA